MKFFLPLVFLLAACSHTESRKVANTELNDPFCGYLPGGEMLGPIAKREASTKSYCPQAKTGEICLMTWQDAIRYCRSTARRLPTSRDFACLLPGRGTVVMEAEKMPKPVLPNYYLVDSINPDGSTDSFYMNHQGFKRDPSEKEDHSLWTASCPPNHPGYAHVYFDKWGGGGFDPKFPTGEDHKYSHLNSVQCVQSME